MEDFAKAAQMARQMQPFLRALGNAEAIINTARGASDSISSLKGEIEALSKQASPLRKRVKTMKETVSSLESRKESLDKTLADGMKDVERQMEARKKEIEDEHKALISALGEEHQQAVKAHAERMAALETEALAVEDRVRRGQRSLDGLLSRLAS